MNTLERKSNITGNGEEDPTGALKLKEFKGGSRPKTPQIDKFLQSHLGDAGFIKSEVTQEGSGMEVTIHVTDLEAALGHKGCRLQKLRSEAQEHFGLPQLELFAQQGATAAGKGKGLGKSKSKGKPKEH